MRKWFIQSIDVIFYNNKQVFFSCYFLCYIHRCVTAAFFYANAGAMNVNALSIDIQTVDSRCRIIELTNDSASDGESNEIPTGEKMRMPRFPSGLR